MSTFVGFEPCPKCRQHGRDRNGDNFGRYSDGGGHCFSCGHHEHAKLAFKILKQEKVDDKEKAVLPFDFTREVPAAGWKWLLQYGLPYSYWKEVTGYSPAEERLILTYGTPIRFSIGRYIGNDGKRKWKFFGDGHKYCEIFNREAEGPIVLVEDLISNHKVAQAFPSLCLFGTHVHDLAVETMIDLIKTDAARGLERSVVLWLDQDQYTLLPKKVNRLQTFLSVPVKTVTTAKDPKEYTVDEIKEILK